ncbi:hypothetical protein [Streptomyces sp. MZ04]|uniref:hypothetical protein n=1 Tax=Streptomyces sp. MZ04 TaxID=2559236 RepID=UPI001FD82EF4|nr:hypothetical protein [Streptomyces sp. MZ04]
MARRMTRPARRTPGGPETPGPTEHDPWTHDPWTHDPWTHDPWTHDPWTHDRTWSGDARSAAGCAALLCGLLLLLDAATGRLDARRAWPSGRPWARCLSPC